MRRVAALTPSRLLATVLALVVLGGCSGAGDAPAAAPSPTPSPDSSPAEPDFTPVVLEPGQTLVAAAVVDVVQVFASRSGDEPERTLDRRDEVSGDLVFLVEEQAPDRLRVQLPVRPNGSTGWVPASQVVLTVNDFALEVRLSDHELVVRRSGSEVLRAPIGVGTQDTPTPGGDYYLKELLQPPAPGGPYGAYAYGLSGFSNELTSFAGGEGVIGIHGTDRPDLVGQDVSSGCIRLTDDVVTRLVEDVQLPLGTPVAVIA